MSLLSALSVPANAMQAMQQALAVTQQNLLNASTPGYAKQRPSFQTLPFDPAAGLPGGVAFALAGDTRSEFAEGAVWRQTSAHASANEYVRALSTLEPLLSTTDDGLAGAMHSFFSSAQGWSANPDNVGMRESFLVRANSLAQTFRGVGEHLQWMLGQVDQYVAGTVSEVNRMVEQLRTAGDGADNDAMSYATLEKLSELVGISAHRGQDGSFTINLEGQATLLTGSTASPLTVTQDGRIVSGAAGDLTDGLTGGKLKGLLNARAEIVRLIGEGDTEGELNRLASSFATSVNEIMTSGFVTPGPPPVSGEPLFEWDETAPLATLAVASGMTADKLAAYDSGPPPSAGGNALKLSKLEQKSSIDGSTFGNFFRSTATLTAERMTAARSSAEGLAAAIETAVQFREEISGVSLEEEAVTLMSVQRSYEAAAKVLKVMDELLMTTISLAD